MPAKLFVFVQLEMPFALGPPDGRYVMRDAPGGDPEHILVLRSEDGGSQATVIDAVSLSAEQQARAWLEGLDSEHELQKALARLNRAIFAFRIASANPAVHPVSAAQAERIAIGWGTGEQVADGRFSEAREIQAPREEAGKERLGGLLPPRRRPASARRPHERFAALLGARDDALVCEELVLRAREDLDQGRVGHAALELERAYRAALVELASSPPAEASGGRRAPRRSLSVSLSDRLSELDQLYGDVRAQADAVFPGAAASRSGDTQQGDAGEVVASEAAGSAPSSQQVPASPDREVVARALGRLEAALRARSFSAGH